MFLDECGFSTNLYRLYGWSPSHERCVEAVPFAREANRSVLGAFSLSGMVDWMQKLGAIRRDDFERFLSQQLLPVVPQGTVLVFDNARSHHGGNIAELVAAAGCSLLYLPPYSPDFSPIELAWSWLKGWVRGQKPRNDDQRQQTITQAIARMPKEHAPAWYRKCRHELSNQ